MSAKNTYRIALFGAAPDTPNMGVSALFFSALSSICRHFDSVEIVVFDNGFGLREEIIRLPSADTLRVFRYGARGGRRYHRPENLAAMFFAARLGLVGAILNKGISLIDSCDAILDASGGDSFSDIYGLRRFYNVWRPKAIALNRGKPLILLPQTYGPYADAGARDLAAEAIRGASMAWARDKHSHEILKALLGPHFNPEIHRCGVDMAFSLAPSSASHLVSPALQSLLENRALETPLVGFNVSGLIYNDPRSAITRYNFKADYRSVVTGFLERLFVESQARVVLIPHVMDQPGHYESDLGASQGIAEQFGDRFPDRIAVAPASLDQSQVKWLISQMDWFCGTRMHSTIASLSSGVPTAAISYSDKTQGVFATCGQGGRVVDPRKVNTAEAISFLLNEYGDRATALADLAQHRSALIDQSNQQGAIIASFIKSHSNKYRAH